MQSSPVVVESAYQPDSSYARSVEHAETSDMRAEREFSTDVTKDHWDSGDSRRGSVSREKESSPVDAEFAGIVAATTEQFGVPPELVYKQMGAPEEVAKEVASTKSPSSTETVTVERTVSEDFDSIARLAMQLTGLSSSKHADVADHSSTPPQESEAGSIAEEDSRPSTARESADSESSSNATETVHTVASGKDTQQRYGDSDWSVESSRRGSILGDATDSAGASMTASFADSAYGMGVSDIAFRQAYYQEKKSERQAVYEHIAETPKEERKVEVRPAGTEVKPVAPVLIETRRVEENLTDDGVRLPEDVKSKPPRSGKSLWGAVKHAIVPLAAKSRSNSGMNTPEAATSETPPTLSRADSGVPLTMGSLESVKLDKGKGKAVEEPTDEDDDAELDSDSDDEESDGKGMFKLGKKFSRSQKKRDKKRREREVAEAARLAALQSHHLYNRQQAGSSQTTRAVDYAEAAAIARAYEQRRPQDPPNPKDFPPGGFYDAAAQFGLPIMSFYTMPPVELPRVQEHVDPRKIALPDSRPDSPYELYDIPEETEPVERTALQHKAVEDVKASIISSSAPSSPFEVVNAPTPIDEPEVPTVSLDVSAGDAVVEITTPYEIVDIVTRTEGQEGPSQIIEFPKEEIVGKYF